jgi:hypothetical protein
MSECADVIDGYVTVAATNSLEGITYNSHGAIPNYDRQLADDTIKRTRSDAQVSARGYVLRQVIDARLGHCRAERSTSDVETVPNVTDASDYDWH